MWLVASRLLQDDLPRVRSICAEAVNQALCVQVCWRHCCLHQLPRIFLSCVSISNLSSHRFHFPFQCSVLSISCPPSSTTVKALPVSSIQPHFFCTNICSSTLKHHPILCNALCMIMFVECFMYLVHRHRGTYPRTRGQCIFPMSSSVLRICMFFWAKNTALRQRCIATLRRFCLHQMSKVSD